MAKAGSRRSAEMTLVYDGVVPYRGFAGIDGVFHLRLYRPASRWRRPVAIAGALEDDPGISIVGVPESVLAAIESAGALPKRSSAFLLWPSRRPLLVEHHPQALHDASKPSFVSVRPRLTRRRAEYVVARVARRPLGRGRLGRLLGCEIVAWPQGAYTAATAGGSAGERLRREVAQRSASRAARLTESVAGAASSSPRGSGKRRSQGGGAHR